MKWGQRQGMGQTVELGGGVPGAPEGQNHGDGVLYWRVVPVCWGSRRQGDPKGSYLARVPPDTARLWGTVGAK